MIHRDIRPVNILLNINPDGSFKSIKLSGFGLAGYKKNIDSLKFTTCGDVRYLSPELLKSCVYDYKNDSWGLGVILYEMLIGKHPFINQNMMITM